MNAVPAEVSLGSASTGYGVSHIAEEPRGCEACVPGPCCDQALKSETLSFRDAIKFEKTSGHGSATSCSSGCYWRSIKCESSVKNAGSIHEDGLSAFMGSYLDLG